MNFNWPIYLKGVSLSAGLIIAIGAQNAFVLRQGIKRHHVFITALISSLGDVILISIGILGAGTLIAGNQNLRIIAEWGGAAFLFYYGLRSFLSSFQTQNDENHKFKEVKSAKDAILSSLAFSFLNPHAILDTVVLIGGIGGQFREQERIWFGLGAASASMIWFFGLAYGAAWLTPIFQNPQTSKVLDRIIGLIMWGIAITLLNG